MNFTERVQIGFPDIVEDDKVLRARTIDDLQYLLYIVLSDLISRT
jgi:hypothetical protein